MIPLLFLRLNITAESWEQQKETYKDVPMLIMGYASWCGHCKRAHPQFIEAAEEYASNPDIILGEINCTSSREFCQNLSIRAFPTFIINYRNYSQQINIKRVKESFCNMSSNLAKIKKDQLAEVLPESFDKYPYYTFEINPDDDELLKRTNFIAACNIGVNQSTNIFVKPNSTMPFGSATIRAVIEKDFVIEFDGNNTFSDIIQFIHKHGHKLLGTWGLDSIEKTGRRSAVVCLTEKQDLNSFLDIAKKHYDKFNWLNGTALKRSGLAERYMGMTAADYPAILIIDHNFKSYTAFKNIDDEEKLKLCLEKIELDQLVMNPINRNVGKEQMSAGIKYLVKLFIIVFSTVTALIFGIFFAVIGYQKYKEGQKKD